MHIPEQRAPAPSLGCLLLVAPAFSRIYAYIYMYKCVYIYTYLYIHACIYVFVYICIRICKFPSGTRLHSCLCQSPPSVYVLCHEVFVTPLQDTTASADERDACLPRHTSATQYCNTTTATQLLKAEKKREGVNCQAKGTIHVRSILLQLTTTTCYCNTLVQAEKQVMIVNTSAYVLTSTATHNCTTLMKRTTETHHCDTTLSISTATHFQITLMQQTCATSTCDCNTQLQV